MGLEILTAFVSGVAIGVPVGVVLGYMVILKILQMLGEMVRRV